MKDIRDRPLAGRGAVVTGASRGIGRAIARRLASAGAHVVIGARSVDHPVGAFSGTVLETAELIAAEGGQATPVAVEMTDPTSREDFIRAAITATSSVDILVNNAGTANYKAPWELTYAEASEQIDVYLGGPWHLCNLVLPQMIDRRRGWIINLGSSSVAKPPTRPYAQHVDAFGHDSLYAGLKAAIHRFTLGLAAEVHEYGIAVNVLAPVGGVFTPGLDSLGLGFSPEHPACEIEEHIAEAALDLASCDPATSTGLIAWSHQYLDEIGRATMSLDGRKVLVNRAGSTDE